MDVDSDVEIIEVVPPLKRSAGAPPEVLEISSDEENESGVQDPEDESDSDIEILDTYVASPGSPTPPVSTPATLPPASLTPPPSATPPRTDSPKVGPPIASLPARTATVPPLPVVAPPPFVPFDVSSSSMSSAPSALGSVQEESPPSPTSPTSRFSLTPRPPSAPCKSSSKTARRLLNPPISKAHVNLSPLLARTSSSSEGSTSSADDKNSSRESSDTEREESKVSGKVPENEGASEEPEETVVATSSTQKEALVSKSLSFRQSLSVIGFPNTGETQDLLTRLAIQTRVLALEKALDTIVSQDMFNRDVEQLDLARKALDGAICDGKYGKRELVWAYVSPTRGHWPAIIILDGSVEDTIEVSVSFLSGWPDDYRNKEPALWAKGQVVCKSLENVMPFAYGWAIANSVQKDHTYDETSMKMREMCIEEAVTRFLKEHRAPPLSRGATRWIPYFDAAHKAVIKAVNMESLTSHVKKGLVADCERQVEQELINSHGEPKTAPAPQLKSPPAAVPKSQLKAPPVSFKTRVAGLSNSMERCNTDNAGGSSMNNRSANIDEKAPQHIHTLLSHGSTASASASTDSVMSSDKASVSKREGGKRGRGRNSSGGGASHKNAKKANKSTIVNDMCASNESTGAGSMHSQHTMSSAGAAASSNSINICMSDVGSCAYPKTEEQNTMDSMHSQHTMSSGGVSTSNGMHMNMNVSGAMSMNNHTKSEDNDNMGTQHTQRMSMHTSAASMSMQSDIDVKEETAPATKKRKKSIICPGPTWAFQHSSASLSGETGDSHTGSTRGAKRRHIQSEAVRNVEEAQDNAFSPEVQELMKDFSRGKEKIPIKVKPDIDAEGNARLPELGEYVIDAVGNLRSVGNGCKCEDECWKNPKKCMCGRNNGGSGMPYHGLAHNLLRTTHSDMRRYECGPACMCTCNKGGAMRLAQGGVNAQLEIFHTGKTGWGVRTKQDLPQGHFVCVYGGQIVPTNIIDTMDSTNVYLFEVAKSGSDNGIWAVDASQKGNVARFINHSHFPNLGLTRISCGYKYDLLAFFTKKYVHAGTELTWFYSKGERPVAGEERTPCGCGCLGGFLP